jgi:hypothetical protein
MDCAKRAITFNINIENANGINHNFRSLQTLVHLLLFQLIRIGIESVTEWYFFNMV